MPSPANGKRGAGVFSLQLSSGNGRRFFGEALCGTPGRRAHCGRATRREIDPLVAIHRYSGTGEIVGGREEWEHPLQPVTEETAERLPPPARRPVARRHSVTGRKGLYSPAGSMVAIEGMERETAHRLMRRLKLHAIGDEFCYAHRYRRGDLLMWDNTATLHCARPVGAPTGRHDRRLLYRIVPLGLPRPLSSSASESARPPTAGYLEARAAPLYRLRAEPLGR